MMMSMICNTFMIIMLNILFSSHHSIASSSSSSSLLLSIHVNHHYRRDIGTRITSLAYGRLARRRALTERALLVAAKAHPLLIRYSLRSVVNGPKTFWYKKKHELDLLFENYLLLVEKLGYTPPRLIVEQNIQGRVG